MPSSKKLILLIPGNPSVPGIYEPFLKEVVRDLNLSGEIYSKVLPHLGQCNERKIKHKNIRVEDVIAEHKKVIEKLINEYSPQQIILIGHSLGSAVAICLYQDFAKVIDHFILLCPFLGPRPNNIKYLKMFKNPVTRMGMKGLTYSGLKIEKVSHHIFKRWLGDNPFNQHIPREISKPYYITNFFSLVSNYLTDFEKLEIEDKIQKMDPKKLFFLFAPNDYWVPDDTINLLPVNSSFHHCQNIAHDFCLKEEQYKLVSQAIAKNVSTPPTNQR